MSYDFVNAPRRALAKIEIQGSTVWGGISSYNRDLTFTEVASGETDSLDIKLHDCDNHWLNDWLIDKGTRLLARIELENWDKQNEYRTIDCGEFICDSIKVTGYPIEVVIRSISIPINGTKNTKKWEKVSVSAIAQDICNHLGVGLEYYADSIVIKSQTQSQQTDIDFLFKVCQEYGFGMKVYKNKIIIFDRAKQDEAESVGSFEVGAISAHVTAVPNHQNGRITSLKMRADTAYAGVFGYELDITKMSDTELAEIKKQVETDKKLRTLMRTGDFYRILSPYETNYCSWEMVSKDKKEVFFYSAKIFSVANSHDIRIKLKGLDAEAKYMDTVTGEVYGGDELMYYGVEPKYDMHDFASYTMMLNRV